MRHQDARHRLTQKPAHARMLKRNLLTSLLLYESIRTTKSRARAVAPLVDRMVTAAKTKPPHNAVRYINQFVTDTNASRKVMEVFAKRYADRDSGLTRVSAAGARQGDGARLVTLSLVDAEIPSREDLQAEKKKAVKSSKKPESTPPEATAKASASKTAEKKEQPKQAPAKSSSSSDKQS